MQFPKLTYRRDIDGLRAVAVMSVILCHGDLGLPGGYVGVDVFFVISGYLITTLLCADLQDGEPLAKFWERRFRRILPALFVVVFATLVAGWLVMLPEAFAALGSSALALGALISNVYFFRTTGYFSAAAEEKPLLHTWSLAVEEQFYILMPLGLWFLARRRLLHRAPIVLSLIAIASCGLCVFSSIYQPTAGFYLLPSRAWELLAGALLSFRLASRPVLNSPYRGCAAWLGMALIFGPCFVYDGTTRFPGIAALAPVVGTVSILWAGTGSDSLPLPNRLLSTRLPVSIGLISYSAYLWHWPLFAFARYLSVQPLTLFERIGLMACSLLLAAISWRYIELPARSGRAFASRGRVMQFAAAGLLLLVACGALLQHGVIASRNADQVLKNRKFAATCVRDPRFSLEVEPADVPSHLPRLGAEVSEPEILVWGDSHAMALLPAIDKLGRDAGAPVLVATHSSTAPAVGFSLPSALGLNKDAIPFNDSVLEVVRGQKIRRVLLAGFWQSYAGGDPGIFIDAFMRTVRELRQSDVAVFFVKDVPYFDTDPARALAAHGPDPLLIEQVTITLDEYESRNSVQSQLIPLLRQEGVVILDPVKPMLARAKSKAIVPCDAEGCFYFDKQHLSTYGALAIREIFVPLIQPQ